MARKKRSRRADLDLDDLNGRRTDVARPGCFCHSDEWAREQVERYAKKRSEDYDFKVTVRTLVNEMRKTGSTITVDMVHVHLIGCIGELWSKRLRERVYGKTKA